MPPLSSTTSSQQQQQQSRRQAPRKDVNPGDHRSQGKHQNSIHVGLTMVPESPYERAATDTSNHGWGPSNNVEMPLYDAQVYAVTSLPEAPIIDGSALSGKSTIEPLSSYGSTKDDLPMIECMPETTPKDLPSIPEICTAEEEEEEALEFDELDPAFALFADDPCKTIESVSTVQPDLDPEDRIFGDVALEKAFGRLELVVADDVSLDGEVGAATLEKFERIRSRMELLGARVDAVTAHLL